MKLKVKSWKVKRKGWGFSLLEILVVVLVVALLLALLVMALAGAKKKADKGVAQQEMNGLAGVMEQYFGDFQAYPTSTPYGDVSSGSMALAQGLVGWRPFAEDGAGVGNGDPDEYGFRLQKGGCGKKYGPYLVPGGKNYDAGGHVILDHWGKAVLYYRANGGNGAVKVFGNGDGIFNIADNAGAGDPSGAADFLKLLGNASGDNQIHAGETIVNRGSFLLVSAGADGVYFTKDDVVNGP